MSGAERDSGMAKLATSIAALAPYDGTVDLPIPGLHAARVSHTNQEPIHYVQQASLCLVAQGAKIVMIGDDTYAYEAGQMAVYAIDAPMAGRVTQASIARPYLLLLIDLDAETIAELAVKVFPHGLPQPREPRPLFVGDTGPAIVDAATRLLGLVAQPVDAALLAPLVREEILIRLLRGPLGPRVAQIGQSGSSVGRIGKAVSWLRTYFDRQVHIEELALLVNMSVTSFHRQFKAVTGMSPLRYQKTLRLQEARRLMATAMLDAGAAGRRVGYGSPSQFTREYGRFFGNAPARDIQRLRAGDLQAGEGAGGAAGRAPESGGVGQI